MLEFLSLLNEKKKYLTHFKTYFIIKQDIFWLQVSEEKPK